MSQPVLKRSGYDEVTEREVARGPGVELRRDLTGRHYRMVFLYEGRSAFIPYPRSGSDWRGPLNHLSDVRAVLRGLGATRRVERRTTDIKRRRNRTEPKRLNLGEKARKDPSRDPWEALSGLEFEAPSAPVAPNSRRSIWRRIADIFTSAKD